METKTLDTIVKAVIEELKNQGLVRTSPRKPKPIIDLRGYVDSLMALKPIATPAGSLVFSAATQTTLQLCAPETVPNATLTAALRAQGAHPHNPTHSLDKRPRLFINGRQEVVYVFDKHCFERTRDLKLYLERQTKLLHAAIL